MAFEFLYNGFGSNGGSGGGGAGGALAVQLNSADGSITQVQTSTYNSINQTITVYYQGTTATALQPGNVSIGTQTFGGNKTFTGSVTASSFIGPITGISRGLGFYSTSVTYSIGQAIVGDGTNGAVGVLYACNTAATTGAFVLSKWDVISGSTNSSNNYNTFIGVGTIGSSLSGNHNFFAAYGAGASVTSGSNNIIIGGYSGSGIATTSNNMVLSDGAGNILGSWRSATSNVSYGGGGIGGGGGIPLAATGINNTSMGAYSLVSLTSGARNTSGGYGASTLITQGSDNTTWGANAGATLATQNRNTLIGAYAGFASLSTGGVAVGYQAGYNNRGSNWIAIGINSGATNTSANTANNAIYIGNSAGADVGNVNNSVYLGGYTGSSGTDASTANNVIISDGAGNIVFRANGLTQVYAANTTWTLSDASGASLVFTSVTSTYSRISNRVTITCNFTYPSTVSGSNASIATLPTAASGISVVTGLCVGAAVNFAIVGYIAASGTSIALYNATTGVAATNAQLSGATITLTGTYST